MGETSSGVKRRYNNKHYKRIQIELDKKLVESWEILLRVTGRTKAGFIRDAIKEELKWSK